MRITRGLFSIAFAATLCVGGTALAQDPAKDAQNKLLSKRAAEADAYRKLAETIKGVRITSDTYVKDFVTESDTISAALDTFVRGVRLGEPKWDIDLTCMIEAEVTVAKVIETLKSIHKRHYRGNRLTATDFDQITRTIKTSVIKAIGMGAPRPDLPPDVPGGDIMVPAGVELPPPAIPPVWRAISPRYRLMAARAAQLDAMRRLVERIKGLRLTSDTLVRDFVAESDVITLEASATLVGARQVGNPYYHHDELIVEVVYEVPLQSVITTIKTLHKRHYKGNRVRAIDIEKITQHIKTQTFKATGMGVPKPQQIVAAAAKLPDPLPDWAATVVSAEGNGVPRADTAGTPQGKLLAARAAEMDAKRNLAERVLGFRISSSTTVRDFVTEHDEINAQLDGVLVNSYVKSTRYSSDGTATVVVEMNMMPVWEIVHTYIRIARFN